jgi:hypothetical protein
LKRIGIALVGDFDKKMHTHLALNKSIDNGNPHLAFKLEGNGSQHFVATTLFQQTIFTMEYGLLRGRHIKVKAVELIAHRFC